MRDYSISPRDRWLALHPNKTPEDWGKLIKDGLRKKELVQFDGMVYLSEAEKKRRQNERQRLCRKRKKEHLDALERENAKLRELVRILYYCHLPWKDCDKCAMNGADMHIKISDHEFCDGMYDRLRELGVET